MTPSAATYENWCWSCASSDGRSAAEEDFYDLDEDVRIALTNIMRKMLRGTTTRREVKPLGDGLRELRYQVGNNHFRIIFAIDGRACVALHVFYKNTQQTRNKDLVLAKKRARSRFTRPFRGYNPAN